ncbi:PAS domain S-box/diguanylate cyclase (GGDEF) domain-containing protein [Rivularia sp. PCC 7116]|uniref:diguanylate cyclase domain-containing protein n=1 Tax=Rivularia sp. PCC 7116 TaxID=373994 RepID=UPI00029EE838|nr:diguanylate cyclase [Rivularia sp. PCC 7116]AFY53997.1 PAS domain S-box/diguanylate cyclase (GGDEF) domain-containing protein [Rivularia sp. PCC 7116]
MSNLKIFLNEDKPNQNCSIKKNLQKFWSRVLKVNDAVEKLITKVVKNIQSLTLVDIFLMKKCNGGIVVIVQRYHLDSVLHLTKIWEITKKINKYVAHFYKPFITRDSHMASKMATFKHQLSRGFQQQTQYFNVVINSMGCGVIVTDVNSCIESINPVAEELTGWSKNEAIGKKLLEVFLLKDADTEEEIDNLAARAMNRGEILNLPENCKLVAKNGSEISIGDTVSPVRGEDGEILGAVLVFQDISKRKKREAELIHNAFHDSITGLPNRILFLDRLTQSFERSKRRKNYSFAVLFVDLDGFKKINDKFGHGMGDKLLIDISQLLECCLRRGDTVARLGGDEFAILLEDIEDVADGVNVAKRIQEKLETPFDINERKILITASIGIALSNRTHHEPLNLLDDADKAMYQAKKQGKAGYRVFEAES